ncbi:anti-sigma factor [Streptomyces sp. NBC_01426]|uniref:anti-sigma factor n=1 Tax=unclassified Streptomyces TaxID=2593676 RepID=UPI002E36CD6F|nr:anti-sigma factor [Streptomyces sp. NBC_01426]
MSIAPDPHAALGAYLLHAVPPDEEAAFARHLAGCVSCRREAAALTPVVADLSGTPPMSPPAELRRTVLERIADTPQEPGLPPVVVPYPAPAAAHAPGAARPGSRAGARPGRPGWRGRWVLAACLAAALGFGGIALWQHQEAVQARGSLIESTRRTGPVEELAEVLAAPDAKVSAARFEDGATGCVIVSRSESKAAFIASGLPKLPDGQVYKLWYDDAGTTRAAGTLRGGGNWHVKLLDGPVDQATSVGVTVESAAGSVSPTTAPVGVIDIPA